MTFPSDQIVPKKAFSRSWYYSTISEFIQTELDSVLGQLSKNSDFSILPTQRDAWLFEIEFLKRELELIEGSVFFEFSIPRMGKRVDVILLIGSIIVAVEFKVGETRHDRSTIDQVWDYSLDLKNFHQGSHDVTVIPVLVSTEEKGLEFSEPIRDADLVCRPVIVNKESFRDVLEFVKRIDLEESIDANDWGQSPYHPTPTIVEAAKALYAQHSVEAIARFDAGAQNLSKTSSRIEVLVDEAKAKNQKIICFVTGVPGAGKTLVGLNLATRRREEEQSTHAVFLSGNGPLVSVLREALTRDEYERRKRNGEKPRKSEISESVKTFIQNVHHFRDEGLTDDSAPFEHVVIFDEAQRAWNQKQTASFMSRKKKRPGFNLSEPEFLISYMDRHQDWSAVICLVGGGQEINTGEAGIQAWIEAIKRSYPDWRLYISSNLIDSEYSAEIILDEIRNRPATFYDDSLHLAVSMRSFRAESVSAFVKALLDCERGEARKAFCDLNSRFPIVLTRSLDSAKQWVKSKARGSERFGLVASSSAMRLKPHAIDIRVSVDPVHYFLNDRDDTRSSYYLEDAATEFQVQGLELDWACVTWDADFRFEGEGWNYRKFRGNRWCKVANPDGRQYLRNAYRVLLTRARQGMVIFVPAGDDNDPTRLPEYYDYTFQYLRDLGLSEI